MGRRNRRPTASAETAADYAAAFMLGTGAALTEVAAVLRDSGHATCAREVERLASATAEATEQVRRMAEKERAK